MKQNLWTHAHIWGRENYVLARKSASAQLEEASGGAHFLVRDTNWSKRRNLQNCPSNTSTQIQLYFFYEEIPLTLQTNISCCRWVAFNFKILQSVVSNRCPLCFRICWFNTRMCIYSMMINHKYDQIWSSLIFAQKWIFAHDLAKRFQK